MKKITEKTTSSFTQKIAAILALLLGLMSVFAGSKVLLEIDTKGYNVLIWLVQYNVIIGIVSVIAAYAIWKNKIFSNILTTIILLMHLIVLSYLYFMSETVAQESIKAMLFRSTVWVGIIILSIIIPKYLQNNK